MSDHPERENRDTDQAGSGEMRAAERITLPPDPAVPNFPEDRDEFMREAARAIIAGMNELKAARVAFNVDSALERQTGVIAKLIEANYGLVRTEVIALRQEVEALSKLEKANADGIEHVRDEMRREIASLRAQLEKLEARMNAAGLAATTG